MALVVCSDAVILSKMGAGASVACTTGMREAWELEIMGYINVASRFNWTDFTVAAANADICGIFREALTCMIAVYGISYTMAGYTSRIEAEDMINVLLWRFNVLFKILVDSKSQVYAQGA